MKENVWCVNVPDGEAQNTSDTGCEEYMVYIILHVHVKTALAMKRLSQVSELNDYPATDSIQMLR